MECKTKRKNKIDLAIENDSWNFHMDGLIACFNVSNLLVKVITSHVTKPKHTVFFVCDDEEARMIGKTMRTFELANGLSTDLLKTFSGIAKRKCANSTYIKNLFDERICSFDDEWVKKHGL